MAGNFTNKQWSYHRDYSNPDQTDTNLQRLVDVLDATDQSPIIQEFKKLDYEAMEIRPGQVILDVGCGLCTDVNVFSKKVGPAGEVYGIDVSASLLAIARERTRDLSNVILSEISVYQLPFTDNYFDSVHAERLFIHLEKPKLALEEIWRVVKRGGRVVISDVKPTDLTFEPYDEMPNAIIRDMFCKAVKNPDVENVLAIEMPACGFSDVTERVNVVMRTHYDDWEYFLKIEEMLKHAVEEKVIDQFKVEQYLQSLKVASIKGEFKGYHSRITFVGYKY